MPRLPQQLAYYLGILTSHHILHHHHHPSNPIATEKSRTASTRFDSTYLYVPLVIQYSQTFQQGALLHESHPRWHSCMCKKKVETGAGLLPTSHDWHVSEKYLPGQVVQLFLFFLFFLNTNLTFFSPLRRAEVETGGLSVLYGW